MATFLKVFALVLSLGIDTLTISAALGLKQRSGRLRTALTFALFEALMPLLGLLLGHTLGQVIGAWAALLGAVLLIGVGVYLAFFEDGDEAEEALERPLAGLALVTTALSVSLDELAVGFSIALVHVPIWLTIFLIAAQAFLFSLVGLSFATKLSRYLGEWAEKLAGIVLGCLGVWMLIEAMQRLIVIR